MGSGKKYLFLHGSAWIGLAILIMAIMLIDPAVQRQDWPIGYELLSFMGAIDYLTFVILILNHGWRNLTKNQKWIWGILFLLFSILAAYAYYFLFCLRNQKDSLKN